MRTRFQTIAIAGLLASGCDQTFEPFQENGLGPFSMFGSLDLAADTQWVRVMPVRQSLSADPDPIDAIVTVEHVATGRVFTLEDSLFAAPDDRLGTVAYAHNFWTTEKLEDGATYRLKAVRSDGDSTTALVVMPENREILLRATSPFGSLFVAGHILFLDLVHLLYDGCIDGPVFRSVPQRRRVANGGYLIDGTPIDTQCLTDRNRKEVLVVIGLPDWPYRSEMTDVEISVPGVAPSNVQNGVGFVGGVARWFIPFHRCVAVAPRPDGRAPCDITYNAESTAIRGTLIDPKCGFYRYGDVRLREEFAGGGAITLSWRTGLRGEYRFQGLEPGSRLSLEFNFANPPVQLPTLGPGHRYLVPDISLFVPFECE